MLSMWFLEVPRAAPHALTPLALVHGAVAAHELACAMALAVRKRAHIRRDACPAAVCAALVVLRIVIGVGVKGVRPALVKGWEGRIVSRTASRDFP